MTSAFLALSLYFEDQYGSGVRPKVEVVPIDEIIPAVLDGRYQAGLIIHEGQLTYSKEGLTLLADMGRWWKEKTGLPLPLGVNVVRKDLGEQAVREVSRCMRESIDAGLSHRDEALKYALQFARGMDVETSDEFVGMYVNDRTRDMGEDGLRSIRLFLDQGAAAGLVPGLEVEVID
jgi:1,4-dihydroxy-6-naphthoate synthase